MCRLHDQLRKYYQTQFTCANIEIIIYHLLHSSCSQQSKKYLNLKNSKGNSSTSSFLNVLQIQILLFSALQSQHEYQTYQRH